MQTPTLDEVKTLAATLPPHEQLRLVAHITERLSDALVAPSEPEPAVEPEQERRLSLARELLAEVVDVEDDAQGDLDAAATIQELRQQRAAQICPKGA